MSRRSELRDLDTILKLTCGEFDKEEYKKAKIEAVIDPPQESEWRCIGNAWFVWIEGKWRWPTIDEVERFLPKLDKIGS